ncbi:SNF2-related protein [Microbacterium sp. NPDC076911]|uniref:DEAD/DEAH box helicase n=1 Tax=Microbacterium sp. NPDC076911 TaxID=3154958 RepID=UPI00341C2F18
MDAVNAPFIDSSHIRRQASGGAYERGVAYFADGAVRNLTWDDRRSLLIGEVTGSGDFSYRCRIHLDPARSTRPILSARCTCPLHADCKHTIATLLASNQRAEQAAETPAAGSDRWRSLFVDAAAPRETATPLALGVELRQRIRRGASNWAPIRAEAATARSLHFAGADLLVGLRPLELSGRSATWIKGGASWDTVRRPGNPFEPAQARWFAELWSIAHEVRSLGSFVDVSEWLTIDDVESTLLWAHLGETAARNIPIVATKKQNRVTIADSADAVVRAERTASGIRLSPRVRIDGEVADIESLRPIGHVGVYRFEVHRERIDVTLAQVPLSAPLRGLLVARTPVEVPEADADEFLDEHLPLLARQSTVETQGVEVPLAPRPELVVEVQFSAQHRLSFTLEWRYGARRREPFIWNSSTHRDHDGESEILTRVERLWDPISPVPMGAKGLATGLDAAVFAAELLPELESCDGVRVGLRGERPKYRELSADPHVKISTVESTDPDWFDLGIIVTVDGRTIPFTPLFTALARGRKKMLLSDGRYFSLSHPALQRLRDLIDEAGGLSEWETPPRLSRYQTDLWADFEDVADEAEPAISWRRTAEGLRDVERIATTPMPRGIAAELRPYQRAGFDWLAFLWQHRLGGILADDMGLGKTLQMLALIEHLRESGETRPVLVVAPTSVMSTWQREAARFAPELRVALVDATTSKRGDTVPVVAATADVLITSYTLLRLNEREFAAVEWAVLVLDEAQFVKNAKTKAHRAARAVSAEVTFAITGTPLENSLTELWSLLALSAPGLFPSARRFREEYVGPIEQGKVPSNREGGEYRAARLAQLRRRIRPLVLRRTKDIVAADLPPKQEQEVRIELSAAHRELYDTVLQRERQKVLGLLDDLDRNRFIVFRSLTLLRMLALAPALVDPEHSHIAPSKITALFEQLDEILAEGHRTLIFSQFTSFLALVTAELDKRGVPYAYLDGSTKDRDAAVQAFRQGDAPVFLISLKAGGFGLTLTEADYVFLLDPWWNPAAEAQAVDRAHRIGQTRTVMVYRLIANGTIEEKVMALQQRKARLFRSVMDDDALFGSALTADDIRGLFES